MANVNTTQRSEINEHLGQMRNQLDRTLQDTKRVSDKLMTVGQDEQLRLGFDAIQKSLEHSRAIVAQTEQTWERQLTGA